MTKRMIVGSCVAAAGGCVGVGAIIKASLASSDSLEDGTKADKGDNGGGTGLVLDVMTPNPNIQHSPSPQTAQEMRPEEKPEITVDGPIGNTSVQVDVPAPSSEEPPNKMPDSEEKFSENEDSEEDDGGLSDRNSTVTYTITGQYPKLKDACVDCSVDDFKGLLYFLNMDNDDWDGQMTDLTKAQNYKHNQYVNIDNSFVAPGSVYDSKTWDDLLSEYEKWLQNWEKKIQSSNDEQNQWRQLRDKDLETFQKRERFNSLFKELT